MTRALSPDAEREFFAGVEAAGAFFEGQAPVQIAMEKITRILDEMKIPYAIVGAMALNEFGYRRVTNNLDILMRRDDLDRLETDGAVRAAANGVAVHFVIAGDYPGDGKPKSVRFPDPATAAGHGARVRLLPLERLVELKLASGMTAPHRLRDLADVLEVIRIRALPRDFAGRLDASVRGKYDELWLAAQSADEE